jgi:adenylate cyclase
MAKEIERKFLVDLAEVALPPKGRAIKQGYFPIAERVKTVVRVRVSDDKAFLTIKGANVGAVRPEYEYPIPQSDALEMLRDLCQKPLIEKTRYEIQVGQHIWEVDIFAGENEGLVLAEVELASETELFDIPDWVREEVTDDSRYYNANLLGNPFSKWRER